VGIVLGPNQYGKAEVRLVHVDRSTPHHEITDLTVTTQLRGDFSATHLTGDNGAVIATDTQKNTVYAFAREHGVASPEGFALLLGRHFVAAGDQVRGARIAIDRHAWDRIAVPAEGSGAGVTVGHDHAFARAGSERRTTVVTLDGDDTWVVSGLADVVVLKSTGSEFHGFPRDRYTTLAETDDRILATSVTARWRYTPAVAGNAGAPDFDRLFAGVRATLLETFATTHSLALQQTLYAMGEEVLTRYPDEVAEVRLSMPNKHHFLVDLEPFGLDNPNTVFHAADRPYGLIEGTVLRDDGPPPGHAWDSVPGFT
jgi:urate oxidase